MRKRSKRGPNDSESTGKIGQEIPSGQPTPLRPVYPDEQRASGGEEPKQETNREMDRETDQAEKQAESGVQIAGGQDTGPGQHAASAVLPAAPAAGLAGGGEDRSRRPSAHRQGREGRAVEAPQVAAERNPPRAGANEANLVVETQPESPSVPPPEPAAASSSPKGYVVLAIGLPGSGKTTWFKRRGITPLSSDMLRSILFDNITEQRYQGLVFSTLRSLLRARLIARMPWNYVDATNLSPHERRQWIKMAKSFGYEVQAVFFDVPYEVCVARNRRRERVVNEEIMQKMAERLRPPSWEEGFNKITMVRVKSAQPTKPAAGGS